MNTRPKSQLRSRKGSRTSRLHSHRLLKKTTSPLVWQARTHRWQASICVQVSMSGEIRVKRSTYVAQRDTLTDNAESIYKLRKTLMFHMSFSMTAESIVLAISFLRYDLWIHVNVEPKRYSITHAVIYRTATSKIILFRLLSMVNTCWRVYSV